MTRVAAIDCGTNSVRLLIADARGDVRRDAPGVTLTDVARRLQIVRLGAGVDRTGRLSAAALHRTFGALRGYAEDIRRLDAERVRMVATSAIRDASNQEEFVDGVLDILGVRPEVVTGAEEAALSFFGATQELARPVLDGPRRDGAVLDGPYLVVDIGGGSTEFVVGRDTAEAAVSVDIGCVRLTERHFSADPPTAGQVAAATADVDRALEQVERVVPPRGARTLLGLAGTVTTVAAMALDLPAYDAASIHHARISSHHVAGIASRLLSAGRDERAAIPVMHRGRVDVIAAGALVLERIVSRFGFDELVASEHDILDGIALSLHRDGND